MDQANADHLMTKDRLAGRGVMGHQRGRIVDELRLQAFGLVLASGVPQNPPRAVPFPFVKAARHVRTAIAQPLQMGIHPDALVLGIPPQIERMPECAQRGPADPGCQQRIGHGDVVNEVFRVRLVQQGMRMGMVAHMVARRDLIVEDPRIGRFHIQRPRIGKGKDA